MNWELICVARGFYFWKAVDGRFVFYETTKSPEIKPSNRGGHVNLWWLATLKGVSVKEMLESGRPRNLLLS